jgi:hypothetical protein
VANAVVAVQERPPVHLRDVATVEDGAGEPQRYVWILGGPAAAEIGLDPRADAPAVTLASPRSRGSTPSTSSGARRGRLDALEGGVIPGERHGDEDPRLRLHRRREVLRADLPHGIATLAVVVLMAFALGRREAVVVLVAVPTTLALTLASSYLFGYTLNRVTLFALIFAIGILVDDAIVVVENIHRHYELGWTPAPRATVYATDEVGNPTILATFTVVAAPSSRSPSSRADGPVHAADPDQRLGGDDLLAARRLRRLALADLQAVPQEGRRARTRGKARRRGATARRRRGGARRAAPPLLPRL